MQFVDLFAGLGGFHLAAKQLGGICVFASEIDDKLRTAYESNFGILPAGDIRKIRPAEVPLHDLLCAGFPCQPFSKAGSQMGWKDTARGTVFHSIVKILEAHAPEFVILENVAHFVRHDDGNTYQKVKRGLENLGYAVASKQLSPHQFGVPQIRERMYLVARRGSLDLFEWPEPISEASNLSVMDVLEKKPVDARSLSAQVIDCLEVWQSFISKFPSEKELPSFPIWSMEFGATYPYDKDSLGRVRLNELRRSQGTFGVPLKRKSREQISTLVPSYARYGRGAFPDWKKLFIMQNRALYRDNQEWIDRWLPLIKRFPPSLQKLEWNCKGGERDIWKYVIQFRASGVRVKRPTTAPSLVAMTSTQVPIIAWEKRYMTVGECARLQSMDSLKYLPDGTAGIRALGNAVNVTVARLVLAELLGLRAGYRRKEEAA